jgi:hypothetical protein
MSQVCFKFKGKITKKALCKEAGYTNPYPVGK